ncbi:MAG: sugar transferase [Planctomycetaceae bacterium]
MSTQLQEPPRVNPVAPAPENNSLRDIERFAEGVSLPPVPWLTQLSLDQPRVNVHCLGSFRSTVKRLADIVIAVTMLVLLSPLMLLTAILVKLTSPGPIIFKQTRVGLNLRGKVSDRRLENGPHPEESGDRRVPGSDRRVEQNYGRLFTLYKFRTMRIDAEKNGAQFAVAGDSRVTPIGRFLRKSRIDELPQLWNVLKGEMAFVGPRPERPEFIEMLSREIPDYLRRLGLKPGLTGVAQIVNGYDNDIEGFRRKVAFDLQYLQNCCLRNDLKILLRTVSVVVLGKGQ